MNYQTRELDSYEMSGCSSFNNNADSHYDIIARAGGKPDYRFHDPRPGHKGTIKADRVWIDDKENTIKGITFKDKNGDFCCSYKGNSYQEIWEQNNNDYRYKQSKELREEGLNIQVEKNSGSPYKDDINKSSELLKQGMHKADKQRYSQLYDEYNRKGVKNPYSDNNEMECEAIYMDEKNQVQHVRYVDRKENERYSYAGRYTKSVDEQIDADKAIINNRQSKQNTQNNEVDKYGVRCQSQEVKQENGGYNGGIKRW